MVVSDVKSVKTSLATNRLLVPWCNVKWCISWIESLSREFSSLVIYIFVKVWNFSTRKYFQHYQRFNVHPTFYGRCERSMDAETTLCANWVNCENMWWAICLYSSANAVITRASTVLFLWFSDLMVFFLLIESMI